MKNSKRNSLIKKAAIFLGAIATSIGIIALNYEAEDPLFSKFRSNYSSDQTYIKSADIENNTNYISMTDAYNESSVQSGKIITISTVDELDKFSTKCNQVDAFLGYNYELLANINYISSDATYNDFIPVGWKTNKPFSGSFNGNGYEVEGLKMNFNTNTGYSSMKFFSMFSVNTGTITNLGLSHPSITTTAYLDAFGDDGGVSYLCGKNAGTISYSYVVDDRNALARQSGITASGGCRISAFVINNSGTLENNYIVSGSVVDVQTHDYIEFAEITLDNSGSITKNYYLNTSIESYNKGVVTYKEEYSFPTKGFNYGTYVSDKYSLIDTLDNDGWYVADDYGDLSDYVGIIYGIRRGLTQDPNNDKIIYINNEKDYAYMYELFNKDDYMASNALTYIINKDLDLSLIPSFTYSYEKGIGATIEGKNNVAGSPILANGQPSSLVTIYNADILGSGRVAKNAGVNCYGLFNFVTGTIKNLNIVPKDININDLPAPDTSNVAGIGVVSGYVEGGTISNVHVLANIKNDTSNNKDIGEYYLGGITGILGGSGKIFDSTTAGSIDLKTATTTISQSTTYLKEVAIGGAVGYIESSLGTLYTVTNTMNITAELGSNIDYSVGGVIGAGYTTNSRYTIVSDNNSLETVVKTSKLANIGEISVGKSSGSSYKSLFVSGVIAKHLGTTAQVEEFNNAGDITVYTNTNKTFVSGVENADIRTEAINGTGITASQLKTAEGNILFYASAFSNGANINVSGSETNLNYTNVLNINASNGFKSKLDGIFNLAYNETYKNNVIKKTKINDQTININLLSKFAPVLNVVGGSQNSSTEASKLFNLRNIIFNMTGTVNKSLNYSGVANGEYISYDDVRNEGNLTFNLTQTVTGNLTVSGLFNEISSGSKANNLYNAGDIKIEYTALFTGNIYASGITYTNKNGFSDSEIELFDPSNNKYDKTLVGSLNNAINNGEITVTNPNYSNITFEYSVTKSANGAVDTGSYYYPSGTKNNNITEISAKNLKGTICTSGITVLNESVITNTFNIADIFAANYINDQTNRNEINASGLVTYNIGKYAIIENCGNDGNIKAINMSFYMNFDNGKSSIINYTARNAYVTSSGIVAHNDEYINNNIPTIGSSNNSKQIIAFTINYGAIYSYNYYCNNTSSAASDFRSISAGVVGQGLLNAVNVMNYGNVYGSEIAGGIFGVVFFNTFTSEINGNNKVNLANTINYSPVLMIDKGELELRNASTGTTYSHQTYSTFVSLDSTKTEYYYITMPVYAKDYFNGSIFGIINFNGDTNAENVDIRYLISFNEDITLVGAEAQTPTVDVDVSKFYSAYLKFEGEYIIDSYIGNTVTYAPLSSGTETINGTTYNGVFNSNFSFYQAILGNTDYLDIEHHRTDVFISDYFEFIGATYVNPLLLNKIGWGQIAYTAAADAFATDLEGVAKFIAYAKNNNSAQYTTLINKALDTDTWLSKCDNQVLFDVANTLIATENTNTLLQMIDYIFTSSSTSYSMISASTRTSILEALLESDGTLDYSTLLDKIITYANGYSELLANSVLDDTDEAGNYLKEYISSLDSNTLENILNTYCSYLKENNNSYFSYQNSGQMRYDILSAIFENINSNTFYENLAEVLEIESILNSYQRSEKAAMYEGYTNLINTNKIALYKAIILNNSSSTSLTRINTYITKMAAEIDYFANIILKGYSKTSLENIYKDTSIGSTETSTSVIDERVALWNQIRITDVFKNYLSSQLNDEGYSEGYIAKATEVRNTYQTNTVPVDTADDLDGDLSFTYTFNVTPSTYFLGPYKSTAKDYWKYHVEQVVPTIGDSADGADNSDKAIIDVMSKDEADYLYNNGYTYGYQLFYYEYSDASSNNQLCAVQRGNEGTYEFAWRNGNNTDFTGGFINGTYDALGNWSEAESILVLDFDTNQYFDANGGGISKFTYISGNGSWTTADGVANVYGKWTITDANNKVHNVRGTLKEWADFILAHEIRHYIGYPTAKWHTTRMSGLFKYRSGVRWFTWKHNETARRVHTSQYIDYNVDQLLQLDGYLTLYKDGTTKDNTEREIINDLFNEILNNNSTNFKRVIAAALLERSTYIDNDSYYKIEIPTFNQNFTSYYTIEASHATSYDSNKKYYKLTDNNYIEVDIKTVNSSNYSTYYWLTATRGLIYDNTKTYYIRKTIDDYDYDYLDDFFIKNIYSDIFVGDGKTAFNYLYQTNNTKTVKSYLMDDLSTDLKNIFISYCSTNQNAYAKLILELIKLNSIDVTNFNFDFPVTIGNSTDYDAISIENISSYTNLVCENKTASIYNEDTDETYNLTHGYTFSQLVLSLSSTYQDLVILVGPKNTTGSFTYRIGNGTTITQNVTEDSIVTLTLNNNTTVTFNSTNQNVVIYGIFGHNTNSYQYSDTLSFRYTLLDEENNVTEKPGYYEWTLPTDSNIRTQINNRLAMYDIDYTDYTYTVATTIKSANFSSGSADQYRYHRIVDVISNNNKIVIDTTTKKLGSNESFTYSVLLDDSYLGHKIRRQTSTNGTSWVEGTDRTNSGYYRYRLSYISMYITVNYNATGYTHTYHDFVDQDSIIDSVNRANNMTAENKAAKTFKQSTNYSTKYNNFLNEATHNLLPVDYSEYAYIKKLVSNTYYTNSGNTYTHTTGLYDSNKKYYTYSNGEYILATIDSNTYYSTVESGKYYVSYELANVPYNLNTVYYTKSGNVYTKLNSLSEQDFYNSVNITNNKYYVVTDNSDPENLIYSLAGNTFDSNATYYTRSGEGTLDSPYVYNVANITIAEFYAGGVSNTYYVNGGTYYQLATRAYDNNLTYYTNDNGTYNVANITATQYYNSTTSNTYYSNFAIANGVYNSTSNTYFTRSGSGTSSNPYVYTIASPNSSQYYSSCVSTYYYVKNGDNYNYATGAFNSSTEYYHLEGEDYVLYGNASKNIKDILGLSPVHTLGSPEYCVPDLIKRLITSSNDAFKSFIDTVVTESANKENDYKVILEYLVNNVGYFVLGDAIKSTLTYTNNTITGATLTTTTEEKIAAAYLVVDYKYILKNNTSVYDSYLQNYIYYVMAAKYQYIKSDGSYDIDKFYDFCDEIGYDLSTAGYGIYALASNQGKLNGQFIPDNLDITALDTNYSPETIDSEEILTINTLNTNYWRGGEDVIDGNVNYAFFKDMKQVEESISTAILEISIDYNDEIIYGDVDIENDIVTFYVNNISIGTYDIESLIIAYEAKSDKNVGNKISVTSTTNNVVQDHITITAENTLISRIYDIKFVKLDTEFNLVYSDNSESKTLNPTESDTPYVLKVTSTSGKELPDGLNLEHFIKFIGTKEANTFDMSSEHVSLSVLSTDHRVDSNGSATITIIVSNSLPADTYKITLSISGVSDYVTLIKVPNTGKSITKFGFDGSIRSFTEVSTNNYELESSIPFGRAYNYDELNDNTSDKFYLYEFKYSSNATLDINVTKSIDRDGLMTYIITYTLIAEAGGEPNVYKHYVKEKQFFNQGSIYANLFANGDTVEARPDNYETLDADSRPYYLNDGTFTYDLDKDTCVIVDDNYSWSLLDEMKLKVAFNRGHDPQYRVKYDLSNFYTLGDNVKFGPTSETLAVRATVNNTYAGLTITVSENNDVGTYTFVYTYTNTGIWENDTEYVRYYEFPELVIEKIASTDSLLNKLTFLEEAISLGNTATVIYPNQVLVPDKTDTGEGEVIGYNANDLIYNTAFESTSRDIVVSSTGILYKNNTDATNIKDYFAVGTVSNADLQYYCPGFEVNEYAEMYQYTTLAKLTMYGSDNVDNNTDKTKDLELLSNHDTTFIYVPFNLDGSITNYLVELDSDGYWTNVYKDTFNGSNGETTKVYTYPSKTVNTHNAKKDGAITGIGKVDQMAGLASGNQSLYMNYVGNPVKGHFWYVSYVIFSEDYLTGGKSEGNIRYYHISIIDTTNTIQFNVTVYATNSFDLTDIYLTISENIYKEKAGGSKEKVSSSQISAYAIDTNETYSGTRTDIAGYKIYLLKFQLQTLPAGYFYFYIDLPDGYEAIAHTDMDNQLITYNQNGTIKSKDVMADVEVGSFLPFTSIITQYVELEIIINEGTGENSSTWAITTADIYTRKVTYEDLNAPSSTN